MHVGKGEVHLGQCPCKSNVLPTGYAFSGFAGGLCQTRRHCWLLLGHKEVT